MTRKAGRPPRTYEWNGQAYSGRKAVAEAAGVTVKSVDAMLSQSGNLDRLGLGRGTPISVAGRVWPSQAAFARHVGSPPQTVWRWLEDARTDLLEAALARAEAPE